MATAELVDRRAKLIGRIGRTENDSVLRDVESLLDEKLPESVYILSAEERRGMNVALQQLDVGLGIPHKIVEQEMNDLLDELERECEANEN
jgi:hypothetical protein